MDGVEQVTGGRYRRTLPAGWIEVAHLPHEGCVLVEGSDPEGVRARVRALFDLDADVETSAAHLARDPMLAPLIAARPGLRVPGGWDGFEVAMRAVLGQQVTVAAAPRHQGTLVRLCGGHGFPTAAQVQAADLGALGMPGARRATLKAVAAAALEDPLLFAPKDTVEATVARLRVIPGVGEWTAQYIALRGVREPDAFPSGDLGLLRGAAGAGKRPTPTELLIRAERWRPYRASAAQHLWTEDVQRMRS